MSDNMLFNGFSDRMLNGQDGGQNGAHWLCKGIDG